MAATNLAQSVQESIAATNREFEREYNAGNAAGAVAVYSSDGKAFPPNGLAVTGGALQSFWQGVMDAGVKSVKLATDELTPGGDYVIEVGNAKLMAADGSTIDTAKFIVVWKEENGKWKWHRDIWNSNSPA